VTFSCCAGGQAQAKRAYQDTSLGSSTEAWLNINPHILIIVFLPILIFESALNCGLWLAFRFASYNSES
jgi:hypothetical protein